MPSWHLDSANNVNAFLDCIGGTPVNTPVKVVQEPVTHQDLKEADTDRELSRPEVETTRVEVKSGSPTVAFV